MKVVRLITNEGIECNIDSSQLDEFLERLRRAQASEFTAADLDGLGDGSVFLDPEDYDRVAQATYFASRKKTIPARA